MNVYQFATDLQKFKNGVLTIGTFDGIHAGHQIIIQRINEIAREIDGESILFTFHPHPRLVLYPNDESLKLINTLDEKIELLEKYGIDNLIIARFTDAFSQTMPEDYIRDFLVSKIHPKQIVIGYDHHFGKERKGNIETLKKYAPVYNYQVEEIPKQLVDDIAVSSTKVRTAILGGKLEMANQLLGHYFLITGKVVRGNQVGKMLGYPTANVFVEDPHKIIPEAGVYASYAWINNKRHESMLYIGFRPTFAGTERSIEINIFDFNKNIYGENIKIEVVKEIRGDIKFTHTGELIRQLDQDKMDAVDILGKLTG